MEIGVYTFADVRGGVTPQERFAQLLEEADLADRVGLDVFGVGEHHRADYAVSAPAVALAAIAARTRRIRLTSAVTVLSSDDPIRVLQQFAEVDLISGGRAEIMAGRGSFVESFPLFGYDLARYDELFATKLSALLALREDPAAQGVFPVPVQRPLPVWIAVGGNPQSAMRAGSLGLPMALAIIGGMPERFVPFAEAFRASGGTTLSINSHGYVGEPDDFFPAYAEMMTAIGRERGWPPTTRQDFDALRTRRGALVAGSVDEVVEKIRFQHELFGHDRFLMQTSVGSMPHDGVLRSIELLAEVRERVNRTAG
ncbi:MAG TPA: LLM class flavin-dependent oxidoreductase [Gaiellaceae bacterium]|nr:LLM class flavin-dependent oxidoreductase [Gaiellaceae bacterium]